MQELAMMRMDERWSCAARVCLVGLLVCAAWGAAGCGGAQDAGDAAQDAGDAAQDASAVAERSRVGVGAQRTLRDPHLHDEVTRLELVAALEHQPSGVVQFGERVFVAIPRWNGADATLFELVDGELQAWPSESHNALETEAPIRSVNGLRADARGRLWVLDNGRVDLQPSPERGQQLIAFDIESGTELFRHVFAEDVAPAATSFLNDLAIDLPHGFVYILETGMGGVGAVITYEIAADRARRVLHGHASVIPDAEDSMTIGGETAMIHLAGEEHVWRVGANPIGLAPDSRTLYWGPMTARTLYHAPTRALRDSDIDEASLADAVRPFSDKPVSDGMDVRANGDIYITDVENDAIVRIDEEGHSDVLVRDDAFLFPVVVAFDSPDSFLFTTNQLHLSGVIRGGDHQASPPYFIWRAELASSER